MVRRDDRRFTKARICVNIFILAILVTFIFCPRRAEAKSSVKTPRAKSSSLTLNLKDGPSKINLLYTKSGDKITYSSADKKIAKVSKNGTVTPKKAGKTTVTVKIVRDGKTYKSKIKITVKSVAERLLEMSERFTDKKYRSDRYCATTEEVIRKMFNIYASGYYPVVLVDDLAIMPEESDLMTMYPTIIDFEYSYCRQYANGYAVKMVIKHEVSMYTDEFLIDCALDTGDTSLLGADELETYKTLTGLAATLKGRSERTTVQNIHDYLVLRHAYPTNFRDNESLHRLSCALVNTSCVCDGYAKCFYFLGKAAGLSVTLVHGEASFPNGITQPHSWNRVLLGGQWLNIDVTLDDPTPDVPGIVSYNYYCLSDEEFAADHVW